MRATTGTARGGDRLVDSSRSVPERICWTTVAGLGVIHGAAVGGLVYLALRPSLLTLALAAVLYTLSGVSITAGYHRLFAHRTYRACAPLRWFFLAFGAASFQNSALSWSADHRAHHADTDGPGDPHAIGMGPWWVHIGWLFRPRQASAELSRLADLSAVRSVRFRDSVLTAPVTFGEGYHSFHHRFPFDYRNAVRWWQYDPGKWLIWSLARVNLVSRARTASSASIARARG